MANRKQFRIQAKDDYGNIVFDQIALSKGAKNPTMREALQYLDSGYIRCKQSNSRQDVKWIVYRLQSGAKFADYQGAFDDWPE